MTQYERAAQAVERLFDRHADEIYRFARYSIGKPGEAEDIVQEVYLRALRSWDRFEGRASERTWLFSIARRVVADFVRKLQHEAAGDPQAFGSVPPPGELHVDLEASLRLLPLAQRQVFTLRIIEDRTVEEAAAMLGRSRVWVRVTLHRALAHLRVELCGEASALRKEGGAV